MLQTGIIKELRPNCTAVVEIQRSSACGENCASCGLCPGRTAVVEADNKINAGVGDIVTIDMADKKVLGAAFLVYIVPLIVLIAGYFIADRLWHNEVLSALAGLAMMVLTFVLLISTDRNQKKRYTPKIVARKEHSGD